MAKTTIIAEAGVNHNGDINLAKDLIRIAAESGADYIKFQTFNANNLSTEYADLANYQKNNLKKNIKTQLEMLKNLELKKEDHFILLEECKKNKIGFLSSAFDIEGIRFLKKLNINFLKIPSGEITNFPYLKQAATFGKPLILSTGMASLEEIEDALKVLNNNGCNNENISLLHCVSEYPAPKEFINLNVINTLRTKFKIKVGFSDHTIGIEVALAAVALGANILEKHFTIDRNMDGPDHLASLEPDELSKMVTHIRSIENALGNGVKEISKVEKENKLIVRKSLVAIKKIKKGDLFTSNNLGCKRPGRGISPMHIDNIIGKKSNKEYFPNQLIDKDFDF